MPRRATRGSGASTRAPTRRIESAAAFAGFVAMIGTGRLRVVAGDPDARLDVVPCDAVAERIVAAAFAPPPGGALRIEHAVAGHAGSLPIRLCRERIVDWFRRHPAGRAARLEYVGRRGPLHRAAHALRHEVPARAASLWLALRRQPGRARAVRNLLDRQRALQTELAYFTHATFDFERSAGAAPVIDPASYLDLVCEGVARHLLRRDRGR